MIYDGTGDHKNVNHQQIDNMAQVNLIQIITTICMSVICTHQVKPMEREHLQLLKQM